MLLFFKINLNIQIDNSEFRSDSEIIGNFKNFENFLETFMSPADEVLEPKYHNEKLKLDSGINTLESFFSNFQNVISLECAGNNKFCPNLRNQCKISKPRLVKKRVLWKSLETG